LAVFWREKREKREVDERGVRVKIKHQTSNIVISIYRNYHNIIITYIQDIEHIDTLYYTSTTTTRASTTTPNTRGSRPQVFSSASVVRSRAVSRMSKERTQAFLHRFSRDRQGQHYRSQQRKEESPNIGTRRQPNQQNTFSAAHVYEGDHFSRDREERRKFQAQIREEKEAALFHARNLIKERNNVLRQIMTKHLFSKSMQTQLKQAQKSHNGVILHMLQNGTKNSPSGGGMYQLLEQITRAHDSHTEVVASMSKHGGCSALSVIEYVQSLHGTHDSIVALIQDLPIFSEKRMYGQPRQQHQDHDQQLELVDPEIVLLEKYTEEAHVRIQCFPPQTTLFV
jgi:hypothetical protein